LLGYDTFVDMSMETKMAGDVGTVQSMIATLLITGKLSIAFEPISNMMT
jgi:Zn-dependent oligopeptidase